MINVLGDLVLLTGVIRLYSPQIRREEENASPPCGSGCLYTGGMVYPYRLLHIPSLHPCTWCMVQAVVVSFAACEFA